MKKALIVGGAVLAILLAGYMILRPSSSPAPDAKTTEAAAKAAAEIEAQSATGAQDASAAKSKSDRMQRGK